MFLELLVQVGCVYGASLPQVSQRQDDISFSLHSLEYKENLRKILSESHSVQTQILLEKQEKCAGKIEVLAKQGHLDSIKFISAEDSLSTFLNTSRSVFRLIESICEIMDGSLAEDEKYQKIFEEHFDNETFKIASEIILKVLCYEKKPEEINIIKEKSQDAKNRFLDYFNDPSPLNKTCACLIRCLIAVGIIDFTYSTIHFLGVQKPEDIQAKNNYLDFFRLATTWTPILYGIQAYYSNGSEVAKKHEKETLKEKQVLVLSLVSALSAKDLETVMQEEYIKNIKRKLYPQCDSRFKCVVTVPLSCAGSCLKTTVNCIKKPFQKIAGKFRRRGVTP